VDTRKTTGNSPRPRIGLALGSGSARGLAHLGVIRAIEEAGIEVDFIAGASMGALIGAIHAAGKLDGLEATFKTFDWKTMASFFDVVLPKSGLLDGARVGELVRAHIHADTIEMLPKAFAAVATDIVSGEEVVIRSGDVIEAVRASISVPGIFTPVRSNGHILVDGGLTNPVPVSVARSMGAEFVIAVDLNHGIVAGKNMKPLLATGKVEAEPGLFAQWVGDYRLSMKDIRQKLLAGDNAASAQFRKWVSPEPLPSWTIRTSSSSRRWATSVFWSSTAPRRSSPSATNTRRSDWPRCRRTRVRAESVHKPRWDFD